MDGDRRDGRAVDGWHDEGVQCDYFDAGACRSCTFMGIPYEVQLRRKQEDVQERLARVAPEVVWRSPFASPEAGFRNKAKLVVGGSPGALTLGILDREGRGVDLQGCGLYPQALSAAFGPVARWLERLQVPPYDVPRRRGELKHVLLTVSPDEELMLRLVLRSDRHLPRLRDALPRLLAELPSLVVVSVNLQPEHKAVLEGQHEVLLTEQEHLTMSIGGVPLHLRPGGFFQTNTAAATALYETATAWVRDVSPTSVLDLYCGVGGFALHAARVLPAGTPVRGLEISTEAVAAARTTAAELGVAADFGTGDADAATADADLVVVNPPRRGIGALTQALERSSARHLVYSSCDVASLARDLADLPSWVAQEARLVDMFPQTGHHEVVVRLQRG